MIGSSSLILECNEIIREEGIFKINFLTLRTKVLSGAITSPAPVIVGVLLLGVFFYLNLNIVNFQFSLFILSRYTPYNILI